MPALRAPGLGPIVGHVTDKSGRIWIRGSDDHDSGATLHSSRRTIGVIAAVEVTGGDRDLLTSDEGRAALHDRIRAAHDPRHAAGQAKKASAKSLIGPYYFRLHREYDRTGTFVLGEHGAGQQGDEPAEGMRAKAKSGKPAPVASLKPATDYFAFVGTLVLDDPIADDRNVEDAELLRRLPLPSVWLKDLLALPTDGCTASFRTFASESGKPAGSLTFLLGSCRYPGMLWKVKEADKIFEPMGQEALGVVKRRPRTPAARVPAGPADFVLMVGDQIYADMLNRHVPLGLADTFEEFQERYHAAFGSWNMRRLLSRVPAYMILDDHEIEDNWTQDRMAVAASRRLFNLAIGAYMSYQWSHGPRKYRARLFYDFACNGYPFFVLDTRTQRFMDDVHGSLDDNHMLGRPALPGDEPNQLDWLLRWLKTSQAELGNIPKFIVSSSVFAPNPLSARTGRRGDDDEKIRWKEESDSWPAFPATRRAILNCIIENEVQNVVFLSGDIHCANVAALDFTGSKAAEKLKAFSVTSSAFYWPFPFADGEPSNFVHDSRAADQLDQFEIEDAKKHKMNYRAWNFTQEDNFCRVDVDPAKHRLIVAAFDKYGDLIVTGGWFGLGDETPIIAELELAPW